MNPVLATTCRVAERAKHVTIDKSTVQHLCSTLQPSTQTWLEATPFTYDRLSDEDEIQFTFVFNAINFCYWGDPKWTVSYNGKKHDGAWSMIAALRKAIHEGYPLLDAPYLSAIEENDLDSILRGTSPIPLFNERLNILREIGSVLKQKYDGKFAYLITSSGDDALHSLELITNNFPSYDDTALYKNERVYFHKRAQLAIADIHKGVRTLQNVDRLTAFADYKIPQVLRNLGVLVYTPPLEEKIDNKIELPAGSEEEVEIRASTIVAIELIKEKLVTKIPNITVADIDSWLWLLGQTKSPGDKPYHRTRTIYY